MKPVAYVSKEDLRDMETHLCDLHLKPKDKDIPLYTHPAELTDEEIDELVHEYNCIDDYPHEFVRACIRKAQEK